MNPKIILPIIGYMKSPYREKFGIPRQPNLVNSISYIEMLNPYDDVNAFNGIEEFSHLWLLWQFHDNKRKNNAKDFQPLIRPPRLGGNKKIGVFASRSMYRPAPVGLSVVEFLELKREGHKTKLYIRGADLLDGTPIIDIKPYLSFSDSIEDAHCGYAQESPESYHVVWTSLADDKRALLTQQVQVMPELWDDIEKVLALNPTPAYQNDPTRIYGMNYADFNIKFRIDNQTIYITDLDKLQF